MDQETGRDLGPRGSQIGRLGVRESWDRVV
jgi:hypothetical protein